MKYVYRSHPSKLATLIVGFGAGSRVEFNSRYHKGTAHLMEHCRFHGTIHKSHKILARELASVGGNWNAFTSHDLVCYHITIPEEHLETGCRVLSDIVLRPCFPADELEREKSVVCQEIRMYDDEIDSLVSKHLHGRVFDNSLHTPIIGFEETVRQTTRQDLLNFNDAFYGPNQMAAILAAPNDHEDLVTKYFGTNDGRFERIPKNSCVIYSGRFDDEVIKDGLIQNTISMSFGSPAIFDLSRPEFEAQVQVFNRVFGGGDVSRLFLKVREDLGLVYGICSGFSDYLDGSLFGISTITEPDNQTKVIDAINGEIDRILSSPATQEELNMAKNKIRSQLYGMMDSSTSAVHQALGELFFDSRPIDILLSEVDQVTAQDVSKIAQTVFGGNKYLIIGRGANAEIT